jgi:hypothetical protein
MQPILNLHGGLSKLKVSPLDIYYYATLSRGEDPHGPVERHGPLCSPAWRQRDYHKSH